MKFRCFSRVLEDVLILIITTLMYLIFFAGKSLQKYYEGRYLCNRGPEGANYEVICPRDLCTQLGWQLPSNVWKD